MKSILLIGLNNFGMIIARRLHELGHYVMAVDRDEEKINAVLPIVTDAQIGDKADAVAAVAAAVQGVKGVHKARARRYGYAFQADIHVQVDGALSVAEGHDIGHSVKEAVVNSGLGVDDVVVHVEPAESPSEQGRSAHEP